MKRILVVGAGALIFAGTMSASAVANVPSQCGKYGDLTACDDSNRSAVNIGGGKSNAEPPPKSGDNGASGRAVDPPGTVRLVACGPNAQARLAALGDPNAALDARGECASTPDCARTAELAGVPHQQYVRVVKQPDGTWSTTGSECDQVSNAPPPTVTPLMVWQQAQRLIPTAQIGLAPRDDTLVNMETIMWVATPQQRTLPTVSILGRPVTVHISVDHVSWDFGDGHAGTTNGPGRAYDPEHDPCRTAQCADYDGHTYTTTGDLTVTATVTWNATFQVGGGPATAIPGTLDGPPSTAALLVREARSVLVADPTPN
jgi:hypothetical protein